MMILCVIVAVVSFGVMADADNATTAAATTAAATTAAATTAAATTAAAMTAAATTGAAATAAPATTAAAATAGAATTAASATTAAATIGAATSAAPATCGTHTCGAGWVDKDRRLRADHDQEEANWRRLSGNATTAAATTAAATTAAATTAATTTCAGDTCTDSECCDPAPRDTQVHVMGQSGKCTIYDGNLGKSGDPNAITMEIADFTTYASGTATDHSINSFATQQFTISTINTTLGGAKVKQISFVTDLAKKNVNSGKAWGSLQVDTFVFEEAATVTTATESWDVSAGNLKWAITLKGVGGAAYDWTVPGKGKAEAIQGDMIDIAIAIKNKAGSDAKPAKGGDAKKDFDLGGMIMKLSNQTKLDGSWNEMATGYPSYGTKGSQKMFTFRFSKFNDTAVYDPIMEATTTTTTTTQPALAGTTVASGTTAALVDGTAAASDLAVPVAPWCAAYAVVGIAVVLRF